jgi:uncharacterized membrane-anchored protein YitT (DUF2179 family)
MKKIKENIKRVVMVAFGCFVSAIAINSFITPYKMLSGGVSGISIIIQYLSNIPAGYLVLVLNVPIFIIGYKAIDKDFVVFSLIGMFLFSAFLIITKDISVLFKIDNIFLSCICGGVVGGIGAGIIFRNRASVGGIDIISVIFKRKTGISIATLSFGMNIFIVALGAFIGNIEIAIYTLILMYINSVVTNKVIEGFDMKKMLIIITEKEEEVSNAIMQDLTMGVTFLYGEGAYTREKKKVLYCVVTMGQLSKVKKIIDDIDSKSFLSIVDTSEVMGSGFKKQAI